MRHRAFIYIILGVFVLGLCTCEKKGAEMEGRPLPSKAGVQEKMKSLEVEFEILKKDNPPQAETTPFRVAMSRAQQEFEKGDMKAADLSLQSAEDWIKTAQVRYYDLHKKSVIDPESKETGEDLILETREFWRKAESYRERGETEMYEKYHRAAIEEGELAVLAFKSRGSDVTVTARVAREQLDKLRSAGDAEEAEAMHAQAVAILRDEYDRLGKQILECVEGKTKQCAPEELATYYSSYDEAETRILELSERRDRAAKAAQSLFPGELKVLDLSGEIIAWRSGYEAYFGDIKDKRVEEELRKEREKLEEERKRREMLAKLDGVCRGATPLKEPGIVIEEIGLDFSGENVIIKGRLTNRLREPISSPMVSVCNGVVSEVKSIASEVRPGMAFPFNLELIGFVRSDLVDSNYRLPPHKLVLMYKDAQGRQYKVYRPY